MKLAREALMHYIDSSFGTGTAAWFLIGKDIDGTVDFRVLLER